MFDSAFVDGIKRLLIHAAHRLDLTNPLEIWPGNSVIMTSNSPN
jgi:hypothetical protein